MQNYCLGFRTRHNLEGQKEVALILKNRPTWQAGKLNGIGGKVEDGEAPIDAMVREFWEETSVLTFRENWSHMATMVYPSATIYVFKSAGDCEIKSVTDEPVAWFPLKHLQVLPTIGNLQWLIPLAFDPENVYIGVTGEPPYANKHSSYKEATPA